MYNSYFLKYFRFNKFLLQFCGVLPISSSGFIINGICILIPFCTSSFLVLPGFYNIIFRREDMAVMGVLNVFSELLETLVGAIKVIILLPKRRKLVSLVRLCNELWENIENEKEAQTVKYYATIAMYLTYGFFINVFCALLALAVQSLFSQFVYNSNGTMVSSKELPYSSGIFHENIQCFYIWYALQIPAGLISIIPVIGVDTAVAFFVFHACAHFKLLQYRMSKLKQLYEKSVPSKSTFAEIVKIVKQHQRILNYSAAIENIFSPVVLLQTVLSIVAICGFGFNLLMGGQDTVAYGVHLIGAALQLLIFCWPPNNLLFESMNIGLCAYDLPWHSWTKKEGKVVEIIISRSQKVAFLSAGKFAHMSLKTFSSILSSAYSFFTLLRRIL
ncbi:odorant receptor 13a-like isoform X3 [Leptopilina boulardi]|uniref:odorant receptor 13a-like isoform X3 n=1 Tax=Leptopilina boulardi TaxID=63433 RepID=UPI0021F5EA8D|nr:odorant receptor 13a-like isoform X3 [Leptopilina boulardi]